MLTFEAGRDVTLPVSFTAKGQPAVPDAGTAVLSVFAPDGSLLHNENLVTGATDHRIYITVPSTSNQIATPFSRRRVVIQFELSRSPYEVSTSYRLMPAREFTTTAADVRSYLGVNDDELPDEDIDLDKSLLELEFETSREIMSEALTSGTEVEIHANNAILYKTALGVIPSLDNRVAQKQSDGAISFSRNVRMNFSELKRIAQDRLSVAMNAISPQNNPGYSYLITTSDPDPITG